jgi:hypothetical protein
MAEVTNLFALLDAGDENADPEQLAATAKKAAAAAKPSAASPVAAAKGEAKPSGGCSALGARRN